MSVILQIVVEVALASVLIPMVLAFIQNRSWAKSRRYILTTFYISLNRYLIHLERVHEYVEDATYPDISKIVSYAKENTDSFFEVRHDVEVDLYRKLQVLTTSVNPEISGIICDILDDLSKVTRGFERFYDFMYDKKPFRVQQSTRTTLRDGSQIYKSSHEILVEDWQVAIDRIDRLAKQLNVPKRHRKPRSTSDEVAKSLDYILNKLTEGEQRIRIFR